MVFLGESRMKWSKAGLGVTVLSVHLLLGIAIGAESQITTYYWDGDWVVFASWIKTNLGEDLKISIDAWNWEPEYSPLHVTFDNVIRVCGIESKNSIYRRIHLR